VTESSEGKASKELRRVYGVIGLAAVLMLGICCGLSIDEFTAWLGRN
jgi:uncharacterized membrane protein YuzA (DUF378 family)